MTFPPTPDNHFVSEKILTGYYGRQVIPPVITTKKGECVNKDRIKIVSNCGDLQELRFKIEDFIHYIIADNPPITKPHSIVLPKQRKTLIRIPHLLFFTFSSRKTASPSKVQPDRSQPSYKKHQKMEQAKHKSSASRPSDS